MLYNKRENPNLSIEGGLNMSITKEQFGVGIVGAGWVSGEHIKAYISNPYTDVIGIYSRTAQKAQEKLAECGISGKIYSSYDEMLQDPAIDIISICTPPDVHCEQVVKGAEAGKHLVVEKPLAMTYEDVLKMKNAVEKAGVSTVVSFVLRWNPMFVTTKKLLEDDTVGKIMYMETDYWHWIGPHYVQYRWSKTKQSGGDSLLSAGCHAVDALRWFCGEVTEVFGYSAPGFDGSDYEFDPNVVAVLKFQNGAIGKVSSLLECKTPYIFNLHIVGQKGTVLNNKVYSHKFPGQKGYFEYPVILPDSGDVTHHPFAEEINHFVDCILKGEQPIANLSDAAKTMEVCFAIAKSIETGKPVRLPLEG
jgi:UDP-N-acetyl-2-amino-2-deoxyglucuronate dehydrogenase